MLLNGVRTGLGLTGSHCTLEEVLKAASQLVEEGCSVQPILSSSVASTDTRFGTASRWEEKLYALTGNRPWKSMVEVEPIGPKGLLDVMVIAPCTGNTLAKLVHGLSDTPVTFAAKAQLRNNRPLVLGISTNDGLGINGRNVGQLLAMKNIYFVPFGQDNALEKPNSLSAHWSLLSQTVVGALAGEQVQPVIRSFNF